MRSDVSFMWMQCVVRDIAGSGSQRRTIAAVTVESDALLTPAINDPDSEPGISQLASAGDRRWLQFMTAAVSRTECVDLTGPSGRFPSGAAGSRRLPLMPRS